jgi:epoxyqueuosine reductase
MHAPELIPLLSLSEGQFSITFAGSPILRARRGGFLRNVCVALGNLRSVEAVPALIITLRGDPDPVVRGHAAWALGCMRTPDAQGGLRDALVGETDPTVRGEIASALDGAK